jgi:hypothetical protein
MVHEGGRVTKRALDRGVMYGNVRSMGRGQEFTWEKETKVDPVFQYV